MPAGEQSDEVGMTSQLSEKMAAAQNIIIAIFNRFGDGVISAVVCREFIEKWASPQRRFLIVTSPQLAPYIQAICSQTEVLPFNKRNLFHRLRLYLIWKLKYKNFDVGLNPYSYGKESKDIASLAKYAVFFTNFKDIFETNYYDRVRYYLGIEPRGSFKVSAKIPEKVSRLLFCPESSEKRRSLTQLQSEKIIETLRKQWPDCEISLVTARPHSTLDNVDRVVSLRKSETSSRRFLDEVVSTDLLVSVDSGPMHIGAALGKQVLAYFSSALPAIAINANDQVRALRASCLANVHCEVKECMNPICMNDLSPEKNMFFDIPCELRIVEAEICRVTGQGI